MKHATLTVSAAVAAAISVFGIPSPGPAQAGPVPVFDDTDALPVGIPRLAKWQSVVARHARQAIAEDDCESGWFTRCARAEWQDIIAEAMDQSTEADRIATVHSRINAVGYRRDAGGGRHDHWATPFELLSRGGDCEDYAIAKYMALKAVNVPIERMYVVVVQNQRSGRFHAVLVVDGSNGETVLDNLYRRPLEPSQASDYTPIYAVNERAAFVFRASEAYPQIAEARRASSR